LDFIGRDCIEGRAFLRRRRIVDRGITTFTDRGREGFSALDLTESFLVKAVLSISI
jgi:hypothetical protein